MAPERGDVDSLLLEQFQLEDRIVHFQAYAGGGNAGHTFRVRIGGKKYAFKMFRFDNPELNVSRSSGTRRRDFCDPFYIECRANGSLAQQGLNGKIFRFCYGWTDVPEYAEMEVASRFNIQPCLWDRPDSAKDQRVKEYYSNGSMARYFHQPRLPRILLLRLAYFSGNYIKPTSFGVASLWRIS
ncbi:hypothetical protein PV05_03335 [Exophiala xenobiotica]|uniref:Protein kinase domain-containing protein n=1 Tax=Exophiala xenobiotica TaxID=348802 RepID=A0A0D2D946_9EURO|nr:uncharacterized protein PV05_03335 [Exophiala xenobiotica]KIW58842.1 hypothetical protein PV05_03335 [Exophiala xenobiotica]